MTRIQSKYNILYNDIFTTCYELKNMTICLKYKGTHIQNMKLIEKYLSEIQAKHWCIIEWEYITARHDNDLIVVYPNIIHFT